MMTFYEYVKIKEGLWLNDKNAIVGLSRVPPPQTPPRKKQTVAATLKPKAISPIAPINKWPSQK